MDLQFDEKILKCLQCAVREYQTQEQTQELRIPEDMPDVGIVLGCWGQVVVRGKEWRSDQVGITGGVMAKILYLPEENGLPQVLEAWLPLHMKWAIPGSHQDGVMQILAGLRSADARVLSSRKLMVRTNVGILMEALTPSQYSVCQSDSVPEDVQLLTNRYLLTLPREAGEKAFNLDEILEMPASDPKIDHVIRLELSPQVLEQKVLADKLVFRGMCIAHLLYRGADGQLFSRDFDVPFSQYADLQEDFDADATMQVLPLITNLEYELLPEGNLHVKAGLSGQYLIYDRINVDLVQDAYSPVRPVEPAMTQLTVPAVLDASSQAVNAQADPHVDVMRMVDVSFWHGQPYVSREEDRAEAELNGMFQMLYYDPEGQLQCVQTRWEDTCIISADRSCTTAVVVRPVGKNHYSSGTLYADLLVDSAVTDARGMDMVSSLELGERTAPDPSRPSLVVTRAAGQSLWQLAKQNATTPDLIRQANNLTAEPAADAIVLIPVL